MDATRGIANPLVTSYGTPAVQQVMSPTQGTPALEHGTRVLLGSTHTSGNAHSEGSGFEPLAAGRAFEGAGQHDSVHESGEASQVSTTLGGGIAHRFVPEPSNTPGESSGLQADTDRSGAGTQQRRGEGEALSGGVAAEDFQGTPTSFGPPPERDGQLLSQDVLQRMQALQQRAPLLYGYPSDRPESRSNSSSLPQEAIQAEVARQLAGFDQRAQVQDAEILRLKRELDEANRREQEMRENVRREREVASQAPLPRVVQSLNEAPHPVQVAPPQVTQVSAPLTHQVSDFAAQAAEALRAPAQTAAAATSGSWSNLWSGLQGSQQLPSSAMPPAQVSIASMQNPPPERVGQSADDHSSHVPASQVSQVHQASGSGTQSAPLGGAPPSVPVSLPPGENHGIASGNPALDAVLLGVQQLQALQAQNLSGPKKADAPEQVKTGITAFPKLAAPNPAGGSLEFQDWLQLIAGSMGDFSDSSQLWWSSVVQITRDAYERWVTASPIERLGVEPDDRPEIIEGKWGRVNARACVMLMDALDPVVKADLIARKANHSATHILFRLYTTYQPGGTGERNLVLSNLQNPQVIHDATAGVAALRDWGRWYQRCIDFGMNLPDPMVLVGALTSMTKPMISKDTEVTWRTEMVKSTLQLHARPTAEAVKAYHRHLLAEFEALATSQVPKKGGSGNPTPNLALKAMDGNAGGASGGQGGGTKGGGKGKIQCKYFLSQKGCKYGSNCKNVHSMNELSKGDRFKKCLNCGSEEHRAKDCDRPNKAGKSGPKEQTPKPTTQVAQVTPSTSVASTSQSVVQATPVLSPDLLHQAAEMYRQLQALHAPQATHPLPLQAPQATQPLPLLAPAPEGSGSHQPSGTSQPSIKRLAITSIMPASCFASSHVEPPNLGCPNPPSQAENGGLGGPEARFKGENGHICPKSTFSARELGLGPEEGLCPKPIAHALLDSGATHPMRQAKDQREWDDALEVQVTLAGDNSTLMRLTQSGTLLLPPLERAGSVQPIVPMGAVIEQLGYSLVWSAGSCKLYPPNGKALRLRVKNGCPEVVESQALTLISRLEEHKLQQVEELRRRTEQGKDRIRQAKLAMDKTWWDHLVDYVSSPNTGSGQMAVSTAPFFQGGSRQSVARHSPPTRC